MSAAKEKPNPDSNTDFAPASFKFYLGRRTRVAPQSNQNAASKKTNSEKWRSVVTCLDGGMNW
jgi:hypothetical protein